MIFLDKFNERAKSDELVSGSELTGDWCCFCLHVANCIGALLLPVAMVLMFFGIEHGTTQVTVFSARFTIGLKAVGAILFYLSLAYFAWLFYLALTKYRETPSVSDDELPRCAVIVPAFNEGKHVLTTLESILAGDYPAEKLEIIAVNDGSTDDTLSWIKRAAERSCGRIQVIDLERNQGKRGAMYAGFLASKGDVLVTIDSDSIVGKDTLRRLLSPMANDERIGGVAGNIGVLNIDGGLIPKILDVNFVFSFDLVRAAQSAVRAVFCAPGALTACRRSVVMPHIEPWVNQRFMGRPANIGEDRALTNIILRAGYAVVFQRSAKVLTKVPENFRGLSKMMIRWARSNVRENLDMLDFAFRFRKDAGYDRLALIVNLAMQLWWMVTPVLGVALMLYYAVATLGMFLFALIPAVVLTAALPVCYYLARRGVRNPLGVYFYAVWGFVLMFWIAPYSLFSVHRSGWLTR